MSKRTVFTTLTALPDGITRESVLQTLHDHLEMIDLNPLVTERHPIKPPGEASAEEYHCAWYQITDNVAYLPGGMYNGKVTFKACFHDLPLGLQTHILAPLGLDIKGKWTLGGSLPGEPREPVELGLGVPKVGLWLREDVDMKCNILATSHVKKTTKKAHGTLVARLVEKAHIREREMHNSSMVRSQSTSTMGSSAVGSSNLSQNIAPMPTYGEKSPAAYGNLRNPSRPHSTQMPNSPYQQPNFHSPSMVGHPAFREDDLSSQAVELPSEPMDSRVELAPDPNMNQASPVNSTEVRYRPFSYTSSPPTDSMGYRAEMPN